MKRILILLIIALAIVNIGYGQEEENPKTGFWELKTGIGVGRLQNLKSSQVRLSGTIVPVSVYRGKQLEKAAYGGGIELAFGTLGSPFNDLTEVSSRESIFYFNYLRKLSVESTLFDNWLIGGKAEVRTQSLTNELAGNNSQNSIFTNSLFVVNQFERPLRLFKRDVKLTYDLSIALIGYAKDDNSIAFAAPQTALENGEFNTQDFESGLYEHGELVGISNFTNINSKIAIHFPAKRRSSWTLAYEWRLVKYSRVKNYGVTSASHTISISRHIPKKKK